MAFLIFGGKAALAHISGFSSANVIWGLFFSSCFKVDMGGKKEENVNIKAAGSNSALFYFLQAVVLVVVLAAVDSSM